MAAMKVLFSQGRRHCLAKPHSSPFPLFPRCLCSDPNPNPNPNPDPNQPPTRPSKPPPPFQSVSIQPVSYPVKPETQTPSDEIETSSPQNAQSPPPAEQQQQQQQFPQRSAEFPDSLSQENRRSWTREDIRYVKDTPSITPVSYPARVAPLPDDRVKVGGEGESVAAQENVKESEEMKRERRRIEAERQRAFRVVEEEEKKVVPFPRLIVPEKKEGKSVLDLMDAIRQVKANARTTFDETIEAHVRLGIDKGRSDLIVRGTLVLPHVDGGTKANRVAVFAEGSDADEARAAGADTVGGVELINKIASAGKIDFDMCLATQELLLRIAKIAKILNKHGLMPSTKQGTVVSDVSGAVKKAKNQIKFKMDKTSIVHVGLGKVSFTEEFLRQNVGAFMNALLQAKPAGLKKTSKFAGYVNSFHVCSTMGPGFPVSIQSLSKAVDHYNKVHLK